MTDLANSLGHHCLGLVRRLCVSVCVGGSVRYMHTLLGTVYVCLEHNKHYIHIMESTLLGTECMCACIGIKQLHCTYIHIALMNTLKLLNRPVLFDKLLASWHLSKKTQSHKIRSALLSS